MPTDTDRIDRLEKAIFGDGGSNVGVLAKLGRIETVLEHTNETLQSINNHISRIVWIIFTAVLLALLALVLRPGPSSPGGSNASINVGAASDSKLVRSARDYLTVQEVAVKEGIAERTLISWIEQGRLEPPPTKEGKSWVVAAEYRIRPPNAAESGSE